MEAKAFRPEQIEAWRAAVAKHESDKKAREEMLDSAKAGAGGACFTLGHAYMEGNLGFPKDAETAYRWWRRSADLGHAEGAFLTAAAFLHKDEKAKGVVEQNIRLGDAYLHIAAALGHGNSCYEMGRRFHSNRAWGNDHEMATFWYKQAACPTFGASRECRDAAQKWLEDPNDRPPPGAQLSFERKAELGENIRRLDAEGLAGVIRIIGDYEGRGGLEQTDDSIEIDLNATNERTLRALSAFVSGWVAGMHGHREATAFGGAEAAGDDDQMSDEGDADGQDDNGEESAPPRGLDAPCRCAPCASPRLVHPSHARPLPTGSSRCGDRQRHGVHQDGLCWQLRALLHHPVCDWYQGRCEGAQGVEGPGGHGLLHWR